MRLPSYLLFSDTSDGDPHIHAVKRVAVFINSYLVSSAKSLIYIIRRNEENYLFVSFDAGDAFSRQPWEIDIFNLDLKVEREDPRNYMGMLIALCFFLVHVFFLEPHPENNVSYFYVKE